MGANSHIEWTDHTFNPWIGCTRVSQGCVNCYAEEMMDKRYGRVKWGPHGARSVTSTSYWRQPRLWNKKAAELGIRYRVFCASLSDVFDDHPSISVEWRAGLWTLISETPNLEWLLLTKRPENWPRFMPVSECRPPFENIRLGVTIEDQPAYNARFPLLQIAKGCAGFPTFISYEPALGPVDWENLRCGAADWLICGGESGKNARPMNPIWARAARDACATAGIPYLFKQWGEYLPVGQSLPGFGKVHGATAVKPGRMKLHYGGTPQQAPKLAFAERGVEFASTADGCLTFRVGKNAAGRLLDGVEHNEFPRIAA